MATDAYDVIDDLWTAAGVTGRQRISEAQARRAVTVLWRKLTGYKYSKRRPASVRPVWLREGWMRLAHDVSHDVHAYKARGARPHAWNHASWERAVVREIIARGWHKAKAKPARVEKQKPSLVERRHARAVANLRRAETRLKRAQTIVKKWRKTVDGYKRRSIKAALIGGVGHGTSRAAPDMVDGCVVDGNWIGSVRHV